MRTDAPNVLAGDIFLQCTGTVSLKAVSILRTAGLDRDTNRVYLNGMPHLFHYTEQPTTSIGWVF